MFRKKTHKPPEIINVRPPPRYKVGDVVQVIRNEFDVSIKQTEVGGYSRILMRPILGKRVTVKYVSNACVRVEREGREFDLHPDILEPIAEYQMQNSRNHSSDRSSLQSENSSENYTISIPFQSLNKDSLNLFDAIQFSNGDTIYHLVTWENLNQQRLDGCTPINSACIVGNLEIVKILLDFEPDLTIPDNNGYMPIHNSLMKDNEAYKIILNKYPNEINSVTSDRKSLLHLAVQLEKPDIVRYLTSNNIDQNIRDINNKTAFHYATNSENEDIRNSLLPDSLLNNLGTLNLPTTSNSFPRRASENTNSRIIQVLSGETLISNTYYTIEKQSMKLKNETKENTLEKQDETQTFECVICRSGIIQIVFECGHTTCQTCSTKIVKCPMCNMDINRRIKLFLS